MNNKIVGYFLAITMVFFLSQCTFQTVNQPEITSKAVNILTIDDYKFKDLNKNGELDPYEDWRRSAMERANDLISKMTVEEKAGVMMHPALGMGENGALIDQPEYFVQDGDTLFSSPTSKEIILGKKINHILTRSDAPAEILATWNNNVQEMAEGSRLGIPVTISSDPRHGFSHDPDIASVRSGSFSSWPEPIGLAATHEPKLVKRFGQIAAAEYRAVGIRTALHPMADLATEPRWGRISGTFGENARLAAKMTYAYIKGFQGTEGLNNESVITMTKHFPGGGPQLDGFDSHNAYGKEQVYPGNNLDYHLIPFKAALKAGTQQIMPYYSIPLDLTAKNIGIAYNKELMTDLLRHDFKFKGAVCTDWGVTTRMAWGAENLTIPERYQKIIEAGNDQFGGASQPEIIVDLINEGRITEARIDTSVRRLLLDKFMIGLFENPYTDPETAKKTVGKDEFVEAGLEAQKKSIVLLQNSEVNGKKLPLEPGLNIYIENMNTQVVSQYGVVVDDVEKADVAILRVNTPFETGEGFFGRIHHGNLAFSGEELDHIKQITAAIPTIVSVYLDRPAVLTDIRDKTMALIGTFGASDTALLSIIFGEFDPSGKLPFELPSSMEAVEHQKEDLPGDSENPLYTFGHGLNYEDKD